MYVIRTSLSLSFACKGIALLALLCIALRCIHVLLSKWIKTSHFASSRWPADHRVPDLETDAGVGRPPAPRAVCPLVHESCARDIVLTHSTTFLGSRDPVIAWFVEIVPHLVPCELLVLLDALRAAH